MKKPRSDSLHAELTKKQRVELFDDLLGGMHLEKAVAKCAGWGVKTSAASVSRFFSQGCWQEQLVIAKEEAAHFGSSTEILDRATTAAIKNKIFKAVMSVPLEPKDLIKVRGMQQQDELIELQRGRGKSKRDAGLDAIHDEIKGNPKALALFEQLKETLKK